MQTIDLGTISIGSDEIGAPQRPAAPCAPCAARRQAEALQTHTDAPFAEADTFSGAAADPLRETASRPCPQGEDIYFEKCEDYKCHHLGDAAIDGQGRILDLTLRLVNVCPGKRVAVGITVSELDASGNRSPCGMKTFTVAAHRSGCCADLPAQTVRFVLPEDCASGSGGMCKNKRHFVARVSANYIDFSPALTSL